MKKTAKLLLHNSAAASKDTKQYLFPDVSSVWISMNTSPPLCGARVKPCVHTHR